MFPYKNTKTDSNKDCIVCTISPVLYFGKINITNANFYCAHTNPAARPHLKPALKYNLLNISLNIFLSFGIINNIREIDGTASTKQVLLITEMIFNVSTILINLICLKKHQVKVKEYHGLISLFENSSKFGVNKILSRTQARNIRSFLYLIIILLVVEEVGTISKVLASSVIDLSLSVRMVAIEIMIFSCTSVALYSVQCFSIYQCLFEKCCKDIEKTMQILCSFNENQQKRVFKSPIERLIKLHRLYISLKRNFKLNEDFVQPGIILIGSIDACLFLMCYSYLTVMIVFKESDFLSFDNFLIGKSSAVLVFFSVICYQGERISDVVGVYLFIIG